MKRFSLIPSASLAALAAFVSASTLFAQQTITYTDGQPPDTTDYSLTTPNDPTTLTIASGSATQSGVLSGNGGLIKAGAGSITLSGDNTFVGPVTLNEGTLRLDTSDALGDVSNVVTINGGALGNSAPDAQVSVINDSMVVNSDFAIDSQGEMGLVQIYSNVDLGAATTRTLTLTSVGEACFGGSISGQNFSILTTAGTSMAMFCSATSNTFTGTLRVGSGVSLELLTVADAVAVPGNLLVDSGGTAIVGNTGQFAPTSNVEVEGTLLENSSQSNSINALTGSGSIHATSADTLEVNSGTFNGTITEDSGAGFSLHKTGTGTLTLGGTSSFTGDTVVSGGTLALGVANALPTAGPLTLGGGTLATGGHDQTMGVLTLGSDSTIDFNTLAADLAFANSSGATWTGTLTITNFNATLDSLRFGADATGLTAPQLASIRFADDGGAPGEIDALGFVTAAVPETPSWGAVFGIGLLGLVVLRRRKMGQ